MTLQASKLSKRQGNRWIFRDVDLDLKAGEVFGIFGEIGSGKSQLLDVLSGRDRPDSGSIAGSNGDGSVTYINGQGQQSFFKRLFGASIDVELPTRSISETLSNSQSRIAAIAEPFRGLGSTDRDEVCSAIRTAADSGRTVILTSSDFDDILESCDRVAVLTEGYVGQTGTPQEIYEAPATVAVASIAGRNNLFNARRLTSSKSDIPEFVTLEGEHRLFAQRQELAALGALNQNVTLMIRPEQISISFGASFPEDNLLKAKVAGVKPMGPTTRVELDCEGLRLEAMVLRLVGLNIGDECMVGLPPDRIRVLSR